MARIALPLRCHAVVLALALSCAHAALADQSGLVANTEIDGPTLAFDWPALEIGIGSYEAGPTGVTVIRFADRASVVVDVRGGGPGTVNTDLLRLGYGGRFIDGVVFSGGSAYGEETITAVATGLKDDGIRTGDWQNVAVVPGAIIYDFGARRLNEIYPDKRLAQAALRSRRPGIFPLGAQGAGRMAVQGMYFGCNAHSGQGGSFRQIGPTKIAAFVVVNAFGTITDRDGKLVKCTPGKSWANLTKTSELLQHLPASLGAEWDAAAAEKDPDAAATRNTTVSLVVTNQKLDSWALQRLAIQVHTSMARGIQPFSTQLDGDTLYAVSTQEIENKDLSSLTLDAIGAETMWDAILASVPEEKPFVPPVTPVAVNADILKSYAGAYTIGSLARLAVRVEDNKLVVEASGKNKAYEFEPSKPVAVLPVSDNEFYVDGRYHTRIAFTKGSSGKVVGAILNPGRWEQTGERVAE